MGKIVKEDISKIVALTVFVLALSTGLGLVYKNSQTRTENFYKEIYKQGEHARLVGIPPTANPHIEYPKQASTWLDGWMSVETAEYPSVPPPGMLR